MFTRSHYHPLIFIIQNIDTPQTTTREASHEFIILSTVQYINKQSKAKQRKYKNSKKVQYPSQIITFGLFKSVPFRLLGCWRRWPPPRSPPPLFPAGCCRVILSSSSFFLYHSLRKLLMLHYPVVIVLHQEILVMTTSYVKQILMNIVPRWIVKVVIVIQN